MSPGLGSQIELAFQQGGATERQTRECEEIVLTSGFYSFYLEFYHQYDPNNVLSFEMEASFYEDGSNFELIGDGIGRLMYDYPHLGRLLFNTLLLRQFFDENIFPFLVACQISIRSLSGGGVLW